MLHRRLIVSLLVLLVGSASAQLRSGNLKVRVVFPDGHPCNIKVMVRLMLSAGSTAVGENYVNDQGMTDFDELEVGTYHLVVSGDGIETTDSGMFDVDSRRGTQSQTVTVRPTSDKQSGASGPASVSVANMQIPHAAAKQFNKASDLIAKEQWAKAVDELNKALAIYPQYAQAYNNLGVVYGRMGDRAAERTALQKAVSIDDHFAPAWVNLGRMAIVDRDFSAAETFLDKAAALDPKNSETLLILANVELLNLHYEQAIAHCRKVHSLGEDSHALVHFIAARALEHQTQMPDAISELQLFLTEEPSGARADAARKELAALKGQGRQ